MEPSRVFRLTCTHLHHLSDLSKYDTNMVLKSNTSKMFIAEQSLSTDDHCNGSAINKRISRPVTKFSSTLKWKDRETRHHSLVSLRTFYAFGARSASVSAPFSSYRSSYSYLAKTQNNNLASPFHSSFIVSSPSTAYIRRSSTSSSIYDSIHTRIINNRTLTPQLHNYSSQQSTSWRLPPTTTIHDRDYSLSAAAAANTTPSTNHHLWPYSRNLYNTTTTTTKTSRSSTSPIGQTPTAVSPVSWESTSRMKRIQPLVVSIDHIDLADIDQKRHDVAHHSPQFNASPATSTAQDIISKHKNAKDSYRTTTQTSTISNIEHKTSVTKSDESNPEQMIELNSLKAQNRLLAAEVQRLTSLLREKEHNEQELKRKLLESEAETKVWRKKYEMQKAPIIEIRDTEGSIDLSADLIDQLDSAAEKLSRFNAVNDLKLLQNEMEIALNEIREK